MSGDDSGDGAVSVDVDIEEGRTLVTVTGQRNAAVVVDGPSGERIYLPPEEDGSTTEGDPYTPAGGDSPYEGDRASDSPYTPSRRADPEVGMNARPDGFRILHPEPVDDLRLLR